MSKFWDFDDNGVFTISDVYGFFLLPGNLFANYIQHTWIGTFFEMKPTVYDSWDMVLTSSAIWIFIGLFIWWFIDATCETVQDWKAAIDKKFHPKDD